MKTITLKSQYKKLARQLAAVKTTVDEITQDAYNRKSNYEMGQLGSIRADLRMAAFFADGIIKHLEHNEGE